MANTVANVSVGKPLAAGGVYVADTSVTAPTDATTALAGTIKSLGYVSDEGLTNAIEMDTTDVTAWGGDTVLTVTTSRTETFAWTFIESLNADVLKEVYGQANVTVESDKIAVIHNGKDLPYRMFVFEILMTGNKVKRIVVPNAKITEVGDVVYVDGEPVGYAVTATCAPDASGNTVYEFIADIVTGG